MIYTEYILYIYNNRAAYYIYGGLVFGIFFSCFQVFPWRSCFFVILRF
jgi:hypothetical protein